LTVLLSLINIGLYLQNVFKKRPIENIFG